MSDNPWNDGNHWNKKKKKLGAPPPMEREAEIEGISIARRDERVSYFLRPEDVLVQCPYDPNHHVLTERFIRHLTKCRHNYLMSSAYKKTKEEDKIDICLYDCKHHMPKRDLERHHEECPKKNENQARIKAALADDWDVGFEAKKGTGPIKGGFGDPDCGPYGEKETAGPGGWSVEDVKKDWSKPQVKKFIKKEEEKRKGSANVLTKEEMEDPEYNWDLWEPPVKTEAQKGPGHKRYSGYDPTKKMQENLDFIHNPQGLTKSERRAYFQRLRVRAEKAEMDPTHDGFPEPSPSPMQGDKPSTSFAIIPTRSRLPHSLRRNVEPGGPGWQPDWCLEITSGNNGVGGGEDFGPQNSISKSAGRGRGIRKGEDD